MAPESLPAKTPAEDDNAYTRLHITPLDQELVKIVIPAAVLPSARNISFHTLHTFPEKRYGFVDLPRMDAEKLKRKLNGTTLKGTKMRIEKARPEERVEPTGEADSADKTTRKRKSKDGSESSKKRKRDYNVVEGVVLEDRKVKRGWTESTDTKRKTRKSKDKSSKDKDKDSEKDKRKRLKSKYTEQDECLLKTKLPLNMVGNLPAAETYKKKKKKGNSREITVHEFEKTTKFPSFLKNSAPETNGKPATEFVEGKGWVDEDGNVVEVVKQKEVPKATPKRKISARKAVVQEESDDDDTSSSGTSSEGEDSESEDSEMADADEARVEVEAEEKESDSSSEEEDDANDSSSDEQENKTTPPSTKADDSRPISSSSSKSLAIKIPPPPTTPSTTTKVHPLEALYKRTKASETSTAQTPAQESQPFSFFGSGDAENDDNDDDIEHEDEPATAAASMPMTPYSRQDFEWRNVRSAAPTPDTAHPSRMKNFWGPQGEADTEMDDDAVVDDDEQEDEEEDGQAAQGQQGTSDFQSWFWENRRDLNQSWMTRRKSAAKEKRHRENKARASKAI